MEAHSPFLLFLAFQLLGLAMAIVVERKRFYMLVLAKELDARSKISSMVTILAFSGIGGTAGLMGGMLFYSISPATLSLLAVTPVVQNGLRVGVALSFVGLLCFVTAGLTIEQLGKNNLRPRQQ